MVPGLEYSFRSEKKNGTKDNLEGILIISKVRDKGVWKTENSEKELQKILTHEL